jgi:uncharacterized protein (DUF433 family)
MVLAGAYTAERASALSGVPKSTIHWWARNEILVPSVSPTKVKLWSFADLMSLRIIYWLRRRKTTEAGVDIPATSMTAVRRALEALAKLEIPLWQEEPSVLVDDAGAIYVATPGGPQTSTGQRVSDDLIDLIRPFETEGGIRGPDLARPRPELRIVPGRLGGSPHVRGTRVETCALAALADDGFDTQRIHDLYPYLTVEQIGQAIDLERQLTENLTRQVA